MKLKINSVLRAALSASRSMALTLAGMTAIATGTFAYKLHAQTLSTGDLLTADGSGGGIYTFDAANSTYTHDDDVYTDISSTDVIIQNTPSEGIDSDVTLNFKSGTYDAKILTIGGYASHVGSADNTVDFTINVTGSTNINLGDGEGRLYSWSNYEGFVAYANTTINIDTKGDEGEGNVGAFMLTGEFNSTVNTFYGNQTVTIKAGKVGTSTKYSNASIVLGAKHLDLTGDITYTFGEVGNANGDLTFAGDIYGGSVQGGQGNPTSDGKINITLNSGEYQNVYGAGGASTTHNGSVTINYNGGTFAENKKIAAHNSGTLNGIATLNIAGALSSRNIAVSTFNVITTSSLDGNLIVDESVTLGATQSLQINAGSITTIDAAGSLTVNGTLTLAGSVSNSGSLTLNGDLILTGGSITNNDSIIFGSEVLIDLTGAGGSSGNLTYSIFTGGTSDSFDSLSWGNITGVTGVSSATHTIDFDANGSITIAAVTNIWENNTPDGAGPLAWIAGGGSSSDAGDTFAEGDNVIFSGETTAIVTGEIIANAVDIRDGGTLTLESSGAGSSLQANSITLGNGSTLNVSEGIITGAVDFTGVSSSSMTFASGSDISADLDFASYQGALTIESGSVSISDNSRFTHLASVDLGDGATLSSSQQLANADNAQFQNVKGRDTSTLSVIFGGQSGDTANNNNGRLLLSNEFTGTVEVREGQLNLAYGDLGGTQRVLIGNAAAGNNSGIYLNHDAGTTHGEGLTIEVKAGTTGYLALDAHNQTLASNFVGGADTVLRKIDAANLTLSGDMSGFEGQLQVASNTLTVSSSSATNISGISVANGTTFAVADQGEVATQALSVASGTGTINVLSGGTLTLNNGLSTSANTLNLNAREGSTLNLGSTDTPSGGTVNVTLDAGATLHATSSDTTISNSLVLNGSGQVFLSHSDPVGGTDLSGTISGTAGLYIEGEAGQVVSFSANNTYSGDTTIAASQASIGAGVTTAFGSGTVTLSYGGSIATESFNMASKLGSSDGSIAGATKTISSDSITGATLTNLEITVTGTTSSISNSKLTSTNIMLDDGVELTLQGVTIGADSRISNAAATLNLTGSNVIEASVAAGSLTTSTSTAITTDGIISPIDTLYSLTNISVDTVMISGALTLNIELSGTELDSFNAFNTAGSDLIVGFELAGVDRAEFTGYFGDVMINVTDGSSTLFSNVALGVTTSSGGNVVFYIPEPSTATLSLLALAGLLVRRRRQAA